MSDEIYLRAIYSTASPVKLSECLRLNHLSLSYEQFEQPFTAKTDLKLKVALYQYLSRRLIKKCLLDIWRYTFQ